MQPLIIVYFSAFIVFAHCVHALWSLILLIYCIRLFKLGGGKYICIVWWKNKLRVCHCSFFVFVVVNFLINIFQCMRWTFRNDNNMKIIIWRSPYGNLFWWFLQKEVYIKSLYKINLMEFRIWQFSYVDTICVFQMTIFMRRLLWLT